jgi:hypothetical protein
MTRPDVLVAAPLPPVTMAALDEAFVVHRLWEGVADDVLWRVRGMAASTLAGPVGMTCLRGCPRWK